MIKLIGLKTCSTCKAVEKQLQQLKMDYIYQDVREQQPTLEQISGWLLLVKEDKIKKLFNTSGNKYKELGLKDRWNDLLLEEKITLLASDGMLVKRPILELKDRILIGKEVKDYLMKVENNEQNN